MQEGLAEGIDDPSVKLRLSRPNAYLRILAKRGRKLTRVRGQASQKGSERLHLKTKQNLQLAVTEAAEDPLSPFELDPKLAQGGGKSRQHLTRITIADSLLGQSCKPEDPVPEPLCCGRNDSQASAAICKVIHDFRRHPQLLSRRLRPNITRLLLRRAIRTLLPFGSSFPLDNQPLHQRPQPVPAYLYPSPMRACITLEEVLRLVAGARDLQEAHHAASALERMKFPSQLRHRLFVPIHLGDQLQDPVDPLAGFFEKEREEFRIAQIFVQFRRLTSTPRVPTISSSEFFTAMAMVKHGSPVNSES